MNDEDKMKDIDERLKRFCAECDELLNRIREAHGDVRMNYQRFGDKRNPIYRQGQ